MTDADRYVNLGAFATMILVNALATLLPLNGRTTGEISQLYPVLITPAPYTFAIWGLIYLLLAGFVIYQFMRPRDPRLRGFRHLFALSCVFNSAWIFAWHWEGIRLSLAIMLALLATLVTIYANIDAGGRPQSLTTFWILKIPFSIYLAWISVATIVNVSVTLYAAEWDGWGISQTGWTAIMILAAAALAVL
ncbi:MAG: tryptophan-rich sensory protein, partial [Bacillota bacterium]